MAEGRHRGSKPHRPGSTHRAPGAFVCSDFRTGRERPGKGRKDRKWEGKNIRKITGLGRTESIGTDRDQPEMTRIPRTRKAGKDGPLSGGTGVQEGRNGSPGTARAVRKGSMNRNQRSVLAAEHLPQFVDSVPIHPNHVFAPFCRHGNQPCNKEYFHTSLNISKTRQIRRFPGSVLHEADHGIASPVEKFTKKSGKNSFMNTISISS